VRRLDRGAHAGDLPGHVDRSRPSRASTTSPSTPACCSQHLADGEGASPASSRAAARIMAKWMPVPPQGELRSTRASTTSARSCRRYDVTFSLGDGLRPGCIARRQRRGAARRARDARRTHPAAPGSTTCR
jgi:hypothetical protein